jgi:UDP-GlcNAc:undecaprenyl-phosphate GlcNAc-1-phosphate transferase
MTSYSLLACALAALTAAALSLVLTPLVRAAARRFGVVDKGGALRPSGGPVPSLGGLAVMLALAGAIGLALAVDPGLHFALAPALSAWRWSVGGAMVIAALGVVDDIYKVRPATKIVFQTIAALMVVADGHGIGRIIDPFSGDTVPLGWLAAPITLLWMIGITNAFNLIDGLDGLAAGVGLIAAVTLSVIALTADRLDVALPTIALAGALAGFLFYNFSPASIFMGDSGSMFVGYLLAALYVRGSQHAAGVPLLTPVLALSLPIADTLLAVIRRGLWPNADSRAGDNGARFFFGRFLAIFRRDREHIHHRLIAAGWKEAHAVLVLYGVAFASGIMAILSFYSKTASLVAVAIMGGAAIYFAARRRR